ncbi:MAG: cellulase family glycosylhydrolase [Micromonosporaceae bacterium]|nr:cellulase family glycosylhydrolase [Micromonosporaceae bacterium]
MSPTRWTAAGAALAAGLLAAAASLTVTTLAAAPASAQTAGTGTGYLHTDGNRIVDVTGATVRLTGLNWFGMETDNHTFHGLWANPPASWRGQVERMAELGFNTIRIPYTGDSLRPDAEATSINSFTNPDLVGLHPLEILDRVIGHAGSLGMRVILDRHRPTASGQSALWYTPQASEQSMIDDWLLLAQRYAGNPTVVGADLFNEPHAEGTLPNATGACWGCGDPARDWRLAAERIGNTIQAVQPDWLIIVEGVSCPSGGLPNPSDGDPATDDDCTWWGGNLLAAGAFPVRLDVPDRLVYSAHDYAISVFDRQPWFNDPSFPANLPGVWDHYWGYLHHQQVAPVFVGEFGTTLQHPLDQQWLPALMSYLSGNQLSFTFWSWNPNSGDTGGIVLDDWWTVNQPKYDILAPHLVPPTGGGGPTDPPTSPPPTTPPPAGDCQVSYAVTNSWPGNFQADVTVTNPGPGSLSGWEVSWTYAGNQALFHWWGAQVEQSGPQVSAGNVDYNGTVGAGQSVTFGTQGTVTGANPVPSPIACTATTG